MISNWNTLLHRGGIYLFCFHVLVRHTYFWDMSSYCWLFRTWTFKLPCEVFTSHEQIITQPTNKGWGENPSSFFCWILAKWWEMPRCVMCPRATAADIMELHLTLSMDKAHICSVQLINSHCSCIHNGPYNGGSHCPSENPVLIFCFIVMHGLNKNMGLYQKSQLIMHLID